MRRLARRDARSRTPRRSRYRLGGGRCHDDGEPSDALLEVQPWEEQSSAARLWITSQYSGPGARVARLPAADRGVRRISENQAHESGARGIRSEPRIEPTDRASLD